MSSDFKGLDKLSNKLESMANNASKLSGDNQVSFNDLYPDSFMKKNTNYANIDIFLKDLGVTNKESFEKLPQSELEKHVVQNTKFSSWHDMEEKAVGEYFSRKIGF